MVYNVGVKTCIDMRIVHIVVFAKDLSTLAWSSSRSNMKYHFLFLYVRQQNSYTCIYLTT